MKRDPDVHPAKPSSANSESKFIFRVTIDVDLNLIGIALIALCPEGTVRNTAVYAIRHKNHPRYQVARTGGELCLPYFCPCIRRWVM